MMEGDVLAKTVYPAFEVDYEERFLSRKILVV
jgi:hypothetical protein